MTKPLSPQISRARLRAILQGDVCVRPASVYDALTARAAARLGFPLGMLGGSVAALAVLGAPDHALLSLDEFAGLCRRICRTGALPLIVDADHGFGAALHAMRTVEELEAAGVAGMTLEDTCLPRPYGATGAALVTQGEAVAKLEAALAARSDPAFVIVARTDARLQDADSLVSRARAVGAAGADALFITGAQDPDVVTQAQQAAGLPLVMPEPKGALAQADLSALGVRICLTPHRTLPAAMGAAWDSLAATPGAQNVARPDNLMADLSESADYDARIARYLSQT
ncbi:oxaloacetate decarboxylase [Puniceibacterium sp. IMCC21224]|uniref:isocitrate lyase/PEP mutase family protein n=1 Tax=Puniceibacterium sp. IMCC21224 TaxID=1618204 RepID=UPI00064DCD17|nr:isocitrate lyase/PEP mutase family protein [Puniceibacterium sp. IMCC21224]KMK68816.1 PEP phosphonomutase-like enzyme [Puniceibacterium sp. IMCC21224]